MKEITLEDLERVINILNKSRKVSEEQENLFEEYYYNQKVKGIKLIDRLNEVMRRNREILNKEG